jgi:hypothetical protein
MILIFASLFDILCVHIYPHLDERASKEYIQSIKAFNSTSGMHANVMMIIFPLETPPALSFQIHKTLTTQNLEILSSLNTNQTIQLRSYFECE